MSLSRYLGAIKDIYELRSDMKAIVLEDWLQEIIQSYFPEVRRCGDSLEKLGEMGSSRFEM